MRTVHDHHVHPPVPKVDAHPQFPVGVERQVLSRPTTPNPRRLGWLGDSDVALTEQPVDEIGQRGPRQPDLLRQLNPAQRTVHAKRGQNLLLMGSANQRVNTISNSHSQQSTS